MFSKRIKRDLLKGAIWIQVPALKFDRLVTHRQQPIPCNLCFFILRLATGFFPGNSSSR